MRCRVGPHVGPWEALCCLLASYSGGVRQVALRPSSHPTTPQVDLDIVGAQSAELIFAVSPVPPSQGQTSGLGAGLENRGPPASSGAPAPATPLGGRMCLIRGVLATCCLMT